MTKINHIEHCIKTLLSQREGREFLRRLLFQHTDIFASPHNIDPHAASYNAGRHAIGLLILDDVLTTDPTALSTLLTEEKEKDVSENPDKE